MKKQTSIKWIKSSVLLSLIFLIANVVFANGGERSFKIEKTAGKQVALKVDYQDASDLQIRFEDAFNTTLYKKDLKNISDYSQRYDLSGLPSGYYFLELENEERISKWRIHVERKDLVIEKESEVFVPNFVRQNQKVKVSMNGNKESLTMIKIYDDQGIELYEETIEESKPMERIFDFSKVSPETYLIVTTIGGKNFRYYVND